MKRFIVRCLALGVALVTLLAAAFAWYAHEPLGLRTSPLDFTIEPGSTMKQVARQLVDAGIDVEPFALVTLARLTRQANGIKAGSYEVEAGITPLRLLSKLTRGDVTQAEMALIEGWNFRQFRAALDRHPDLRHDTLGLTDAEILERIGANARHPEGLFYPDTYLFAKRSSDVDLLRRAHQNLQNVLASEWDRRADGLPYRNAYQALIMASIVEKETGKASERQIVAGLYSNRLRQGIMLQADPTIIYPITKGKPLGRRIRQSEIQAVNDYNTYSMIGLPKGPITNPGKASIAAVLHPAQTDALYMVADGTGGHQFASTLEQHNVNVEKWYTIRKERGDF